MTEIFDEVCTSYDNCTWIGRDGVKRAIDRLKAAHESEIAELQRQYEQNVIELQRAHRREMETVRDPQRIGGTLERDSFEYALEQLREFRWQHATNDNDAIPYINGIAKAHEHEMERLRKKCFREGYEAGQRSMEAKHRTVTERLVKLDLAGGSHENLSAIASCFYQPTFGWTWGACEILRDKLIEILEGKDGNDDNDNSDGCNRNHHHCNQRQVSYDELGNERHKAIAELREIQTDAGGFVRSLARAIGVEWQAQRAEQTITEVRDRLIHLLGGDQPTLSDLYGIWQDGEASENRGSESAHKMTKSAETINLGDESDSELMENGENHKFDGRITDELREYNNKQIKWLDMTKVHYRKLFDIADRIDEHVRQLERDVEMWRGRAEDIRMERDELQAKLDDYDKTHVELPKDATGYYWHIGDESEYGEVTGILYNNARTIIEVRMGNGERNMFGASLGRKAKPVTVEQVIRDLTLGKITESQAVERIEGINV